MPSLKIILVHLFAHTSLLLLKREKETAIFPILQNLTHILVITSCFGLACSRQTGHSAISDTHVGRGKIPITASRWLDGRRGVSRFRHRPPPSRRPQGLAASGQQPNPGEACEPPTGGRGCNWPKQPVRSVHCSPSIQRHSRDRASWGRFL